MSKLISRVEGFRKKESSRSRAGISWSMIASHSPLLLSPPRISPWVSYRLTYRVPARLPMWPLAFGETRWKISLWPEKTIWISLFFVIFSQLILCIFIKGIPRRRESVGLPVCFRNSMNISLEYGNFVIDLLSLSLSLLFVSLNI